MFVDLSESTQLLALESTGLDLARVELRDRDGRVGLIWGERPAGTLLIEGRRPILAGPVVIRVAFEGAYPDSGWGLVRKGRSKQATLRSQFLGAGASAAFPCMLGVGPQVWAFTIETPLTHKTRTNLRLARTGRAPGVRTEVFRSTEPLPVDSLRIEVRPRPRR